MPLGKVSSFPFCIFSSFREYLNSSALPDAIPYLPPLPERGTGNHRIILLWLRDVSASDIFGSDATRRNLPSSKLQSYTDKIIAYNFFLTCWSRKVSEQYFKTPGCPVQERVFGETLNDARAGQ